MKAVLAALCIFALTPLAHSAEDTSPRGRCLAKAAKREQVVNKHIKRLEQKYPRDLPGSRSVYSGRVVSSTYSTSDGASVGIDGQVYEQPTKTATYYVSIASEYQTQVRELKVIEAQKRGCDRLARKEQAVAKPQK